MALDTKTANALKTLASQYGEPDMLMHVSRDEAALMAKAILKQPTSFHDTVFASHAQNVTSSAETLLSATKDYAKSSGDMIGKSDATLDIAHTRFIKGMAESGVGLNMLQRELENSRSTFSKPKMAIAAATVALGAYVAYKVFSKDHPEHATDAQQR